MKVGIRDGYLKGMEHKDIWTAARSAADSCTGRSAPARNDPRIISPWTVKKGLKVE